MATCANPKCGAEFAPRQQGQRACSTACSQPARRANPEVRTAEHARAARLDVKEAAAAAQRARLTNPETRTKRYAEQRTRRQTATYGAPTPDILMQTKDRFRHARALGYRSGLEVKNARHLEALGAEFQYEPFRLPYVKPERTATYTTDFFLPNGILVDTKGAWLAEDRQKFALLKAQHPDLDIRMVFTNPNAKISKTSKTSYADVCIKLGLPFAKDTIPTAWLNEPANGASLAAIARLRK